MKNHTLNISLAALIAAAPLLGATGAFAGNPVPTPVEVAPAAPAPVAFVSRWAGGYVGAQAGYGWADNEPTDPNDKNNDGIADSLQTSVTNVRNAINNVGKDGDGALGGVFAGYRGNYNQFVYGGEGSYDFADIQFDNSAGSIDGLGRLKVMAGYDLGQTLLYATAGAAYGDGEIGGKNHDDWGWLAGIGADYLITDQWSVGAEVLYHDFGEFGDSGTDVSLTTLEARVSYHF